MKKISNVILAASFALSLVGCSEFLDRPALTSMDDENYWSSETTVRMFVNDCYGSYFNGYSDNWGSTYAPGVYTGEYSDDKTTTGTQFSILTSVPADNWYRDTGAGYRGYWLQRRGSGPWNLAYQRKWNLLLERLDGMKEAGKLSDEAYNHWSGVAKFFRAWEYSRFVESFGDVPLYTTTVATSDLESQYKARDPRTTVMDQVLEDFKYALANVRADDGADYVNKYVVGTIASRCLLFEGTWLTFHKNDEALKTCSDVDGHAKKYLEEARNMAAVVMDSGKYGFDSDFRKLFGTINSGKNNGGNGDYVASTLTGVANEVILYRSYAKEVVSGAQHCIASYSNGDEGQSIGGNLSTIKAFICNDGLTYNKSEAVDANGVAVRSEAGWRLQSMVTTRDPRFEATFWDEPKNSATGLYIEKFISRKGIKYAYNGEARPAAYGSCTNENGFPCVRYAETVLNWLEAKATLADYFGGAAVSDADLDRSINAIRQRPLDEEAIAKGVKKTAPLTVAKANAMADPERTSAAIHSTLGYQTRGEISPILWEVRRERRMEFVAEQVRVLDIRRWGQLELLDYDVNTDGAVGAYVELDLARTIKDGQTTNLKKTKKDVGYDLLTAAKYGIVKVRPFAGFDANGALVLGEPITWNEGVDPASMRGFLVPENFANRNSLNFAKVNGKEMRNYLEPVCTDIIDQYAEAGFEDAIKQNPGWE